MAILNFALPPEAFKSSIYCRSCPSFLDLSQSGLFRPTMLKAVSQVTPTCFPRRQQCVLTFRFASELGLNKAGELEPKKKEPCVAAGICSAGATER